MQDQKATLDKVKTWVLASLLMPFIIALNGCSSKEENTKVNTSVKVETQALSRIGMAEQLHFSGSLQPDNTVQLGFSLPGRVAGVMVQEGQYVTKGQLLASLETTEYQNAFLIAQAGLDQARDNFNRADELHLKGSFTEKDYIAARIALSQTKANSSMAEKRLADSYLKAPFAGIVTARLTEVGASAAPGVPVFTLMKTDFVYAQASVPETEISKLSVGSNASVDITSLHAQLNGTISIINPQADLQSKTYTIKIRIPNTTGQLMPGMIADIKVTTGQQVNAIMVPFTAVWKDADDLTYVFVVNKDKKAVKKRISVGSLSDSTLIVTSGLREGESIITRGQKNIYEGQQLSIN